MIILTTSKIPQSDTSKENLSKEPTNLKTLVDQLHGNTDTSDTHTVNFKTGEGISEVKFHLAKTKAVAILKHLLRAIPDEDNRRWLAEQLVDNLPKNYIENGVNRGFQHYI
ncbi:hypothetical protein [Rhizobium sp. Root482]|uniref:hypothetical protein n=1 Tax=Rhizobium sp. Root482 TaxID=1736543 RepID=UPI0006F34A1E|nr:hypothetical protein [Rhizobium sp. Root482]KQY14416.1 hypothetical protein ASD31_09105 [Rhizobium sp. Root482]